MILDREKKRQEFLSAMHAQDIKKVSPRADTEYNPQQHRINAKNTITLCVMLLSACALLACMVIL
jgi:hypothetical protein